MHRLRRSKNGSCLQSLQREYGADKFVCIGFDITDRSRMEALVEEIRQKHGKLDGIVANAGMLEPVKSISSRTPNTTSSSGNGCSM